jgi:hypothetical protein
MTTLHVTSSDIRAVISPRTEQGKIDFFNRAIAVTDLAEAKPQSVSQGNS